MVPRGHVLNTTIYEAVTQTIVEALERGVIPWRRPWKLGSARPCNATTGRIYRGVNCLLLGISGYTDHRWLTFKQVMDAGGKVRKSEKASFVIFWKRWQPPQADGKTEDSKREIPLLRRYFVFNVEQCEGLCVSPLEVGLPLPQSERLLCAEKIVRSLADPPQIEEKGDIAFYSPHEDLVRVPKLRAFERPEAFYATLFHELGHATGHSRRLNRPGVSQRTHFGSDSYCREELVAELASAFCCAAIGLDNSLLEDSASYLSGWLGVLKSDSKAFVTAAGLAQKAADHLMQTMP